MGLFKSQKSVNANLFNAIYDQYVTKVFSSFSKDDSCCYGSLLSGASLLASHMLEIDKNLKKAWGKGSPVQGRAMFEICVQPMISMWLSHKDAQVSYTGGERKNVGKTTMSNILNVLGTYSDKKVENFLNLDLQYVYDNTRSENKHISMYYVDLFLSELAEALGYQNFIDWDKQHFPVKTTADFRFINQDHPYLDFGYDLQSRMSTLMAISMNQVSMIQDYKFLSGISGHSKASFEHHDEELMRYNRSLKLHPDDPAVLSSRGRRLLELEIYEEALSDFNRLLEMRPSDLDALQNRGDTLFELGRYEEALNDYNRLLELQPDDSDVLASRGDVLYELKKFEEALRDYDRLLEISSDDTLTLEGRGDSLYELGRYEEALDAYNRLLELEPDNSEVLKSRAAVLRDLKRHS